MNKNKSPLGVLLSMFCDENDYSGIINCILDASDILDRIARVDKIFPTTDEIVKHRDFLVGTANYASEFFKKMLSLSRALEALDENSASKLVKATHNELLEIERNIKEFNKELIRKGIAKREKIRSAAHKKS